MQLLMISVSLAWYAIDRHSSELWQARIEALGLLHEKRSDTVIDRSADALRKRVGQEKKATSCEKCFTRKANQLYSRYFFSWQWHICWNCKPADLSSLLPCCKKPFGFRWVSMYTITCLTVRKSVRDTRSKRLLFLCFELLASRVRSNRKVFRFVDEGEDSLQVRSEDIEAYARKLGLDIKIRVKRAN